MCSAQSVHSKVVISPERVKVKVGERGRENLEGLRDARESVRERSLRAIHTFESPDWLRFSLGLQLELHPDGYPN